MIAGRCVTSSTGTGAAALPFFTRTVSDCSTLVARNKSVLQELERMPRLSLTMIVDASPKAKMDESRPRGL